MFGLERLLDTLERLFTPLEQREQLERDLVRRKIAVEEGQLNLVDKKPPVPLPPLPLFVGFDSGDPSAAILAASLYARIAEGNSKSTDPKAENKP